MDYQLKARVLVTEFVNNHLDKSDLNEGVVSEIVVDDTYVVWFSKTLQNWKALVSTILPDGKYYEVTYNGDKKETYIDGYVKFDNVSVSD